MKWVSTFKYLPINYNTKLAEIENQTQRLIFDNNLNGDIIRIRLSNKYSHKNLCLEKITISKVKGSILENTTSITKNGQTIVNLLPNEECWSDEIKFKINSGDKLAVSIYIKDKQEIASACVLWSKTGAVISNSVNGDFTNKSEFEQVDMQDIYKVVKDDVNKGMMFYGFTTIQVLTDDNVKTIAAFGDSITHMSYFTNALYKRLCSEFPAKVSLINCGIGGNRVLHDATYAKDIVGNGSLFGEAGIKRFENDIFEYDNVDTILVLEGINDIMHPFVFSQMHELITADDLENGLKEYVKIARKHNSKIFGATIMPCGHEICTDEMLMGFEKVRQDINARIRNNQIGYDGYFDYDKAVRMTDKQDYMDEKYHIGDGLHPNDLGGECMADKVDIDLITKEKKC